MQDELYFKVIDCYDSPNIDDIQEVRRILLMNYGIDTQRRDAVELREKVWKLLLGIHKLSSDQIDSYYDILEAEGMDFSHLSLNADVKRTSIFTNMKEEQKNLFELWAKYCTHVQRDWSDDRYSQGWLYLGAPVAYVMRNERDGLFSIVKLYDDYVPGIIGSPVSRFEKISSVFNEILEFFDPELSSHLKKQGYNAGTFTINSCINNHSATGNTASHGDLLRLWDIAICLGFHMHIVFAVARHYIVRDEIFRFDRLPEGIPFEIMPLQAEIIIRLSLGIVQSLPPVLYEKLVETQFTQ